VLQRTGDDDDPRRSGPGGDGPDRVGQAAVQQARRGADRDLVEHLLARTEQGLGALGLVYDHLRVRQEAPPIKRDCRPAGAAREQLRTDKSFELSNTSGQTWLAHAQPARRLGKAAILGDRDEMLEGSDLQGHTSWL